MKWQIHQDRDEEDVELESYSITMNPKFGGWNTDSGYDGYGFPKELAMWICDTLNNSQSHAPYIMNQYGCWVKRKINKY